MKKITDPAPVSAASPAPAALVKYEVLADSVNVPGAIAYRTARVNLTPAQADAINAAQPGSLKFLGL